MLASHYCFLAVFLSFLLVFCFPELLCQTPRRSGKNTSSQREKYIWEANTFRCGQKSFSKRDKSFPTREKCILPKREKSLRKRRKYFGNEKITGNGKNTRSKPKKSRKREKYRFEAGKIRSQKKTGAWIQFFLPYSLCKSPGDQTCYGKSPLDNHSNRLGCGFCCF